MSIAERARIRPAEIPQRERPISEEYRIAAKQWVEDEKAAAILEESKTAVLSQLMMKKGDVPVSKAEMMVKASQEWMDHLNIMVDARSAANLSRVRMKYVEMRFSEWQSADANARRERAMGRQTP